MTRTVIGGSACPPAMIDKFRDLYDVEVLHAWGMTELSPLGSVNNLKNKHLDLPEAEIRNCAKTRAVRLLALNLAYLTMMTTNCPMTAKAQGNLYCRGYWVLTEYFGGDGGDPLRNGWFPTGDVSTIDADGYMTIRDRSKDIIKSGGEWISTVDLENLAVSHPDIAEAAVISAQPRKMGRAAIADCCAQSRQNPRSKELLEFLRRQGRQMVDPRCRQFVDDIPKGATGKILKNALRDNLERCWLGNELPIWSIFTWHIPCNCSAKQANNY